jgi:chaperonin GroES
MALDYASDVEPDPADMAPEEGGEQEQPAAAKLLGYLQVPNLVTEITEEQRTEIARKCIDGYKLDDASREAWKVRTQAALDLAMLLAEEKDYPFAKAANVKYPLLTTAAIQFNARTYPAFIQNDRVAKCKVNGHDADGAKAKRAERVSEHMSWQLLTEMPEWEPDTDRLLLIVPIVGSAFRKRYWDPTLKRQCSRLVTADRLVMNYRSRSIKDTPRISEELYLYPYEIEERIRDGRFAEFEYGDARPDPEDPNASAQTDSDAPHKFIEQHRLYDLDEDGYPEPYIATVHLESEKLCRLVPNYDAESVTVTPEGKVAAVRKRDYYVQYSFLPSPDGGIYGMGFGWLLLSTNEAINTTLNEMLDAGHLSNLQAGFITSAAGLKDKKITLGKGEFKVLNTNMPVNQAVSFAQFPGPSETLFKLLGFMVEQGKEISATKDVMTGDTGGKVMQPTTVMALIEQGMKVFNAITKRMFRSFRDELGMHVDLNEKNLSPEAYNEFWDDPNEQFDPKADYNAKDMNVTPVADPAMATAMQKVAKAELIGQIAMGKPWFNQPAVDKRRLEAAEVENVDELFVPPPQPDPFMEAMKEMNLLQLKATIEKLETEATKNDTASLANIATAQAAEAGEQTNAYMLLLKYFQAEHGMERQNAQDAAAVQQGGLPGMEGQPDDAAGARTPQGPGGGDGAMGGGAGMEPGPIPNAAGMGGGAAPASPSGGAM